MPNEGRPRCTETKPETELWLLEEELPAPPLTLDFPSLSEPARSTKLILEVMYFASDKVREWAYETPKKRLNCHREKVLTEQAPWESTAPLGSSKSLHLPPRRL